MRELWSDQHATMETRWNWTLPLQCLWTILQDEWTEPTPHQAQTKIGECKNPTNFVLCLAYSDRSLNLSFEYIAVSSGSATVTERSVL